MGYSIDFLTNSYGEDVIINLSMGEDEVAKVFNLEKESIKLYVEKEDFEEAVIFINDGNNSDKLDIIIEEEVAKAPLSVVERFKNLYKEKYINFVGIMLANN